MGLSRREFAAGLSTVPLGAVLAASFPRTFTFNYRTLIPDNYRINFRVETGSYSDTATATVDVRNPHILDLKVKQGNCSRGSFTARVINQGSETEKVKITAGGKLLLESEIAPGKAMSIPVPYTEGKILKARSKNSYAGDQVEVKTPGCWGKEDENQDLISGIVEFLKDLFR